MSYTEYDANEEMPLLKIQKDGILNPKTFVGKYATKRLPLKWHMHEYLQINYIYKGTMKHVINKCGFEVMKGDIFVIPPYVPHTLIDAQQGDGVIYEFEFEPEFINQNFGDIENVKSFFDFAYIEPFLVSESQVKPRLNLTGKIQKEVEEILEEALMEYTEKEDGYDLLIKSLLLKLLVLVGREFNRTLVKIETNKLYTSHRDAIYNAIKFIDENYTQYISVGDAARVSMLSQSYFSTLFKTITTKTFVEYLNGLRISQAMELLRTTNKRVIDICCDVGFNNVNYFNKLFRNITGVTPLYYRRNVESLKDRDIQ